jgi:hypothetical protein
MKKNSRLTYTKKDGGRELKQSSVTPEQVATESVHPFPTLSLPEGYTKTDGIFSYSLACVISGGTTREKVFLNELVKKHTFRGLEIIFISSSQGEGGLTPRMMQKAYHLLCKDGVRVTSPWRKWMQFISLRMWIIMPMNWLSYWQLLPTEERNGLSATLISRFGSTIVSGTPLMKNLRKCWRRNRLKGVHC